MYLTRDYLKVDPWTALINLINNNYNYELQPGIVKLKAMTSLGPKLTQIEIIPNRSTNPNNSLPVITETIFTYERLDAGEFFRTQAAVDISGLMVPFTTLDILRLIGERNDIVFTVDDFHCTTYETFSSLGSPDILITADSHSMRFVGAMKVRLVNTLKKDLTPVPLRVTEFPKVNAVNPLGKVVADYCMSRYDFTEYRNTLHPIPVGRYDNIGKVLGPIFAVTSQWWNNSPNPLPLNLTWDNTSLNAKVLYNGPPIPGWSTRTEFNRVLVIELSYMSTGAAGALRLHYN